MDGQEALAASVGAVATLIEVRQVAVSAQLEKNPDGRLTADVKLRNGWVQEEDLLVCEVGCDLVVSEHDSGDRAFVASVTFGGIYTLPAEFEPRPDAFNAFCSILATFALRPYVRESLQSLTTRAGIPAFVLRPARLPLAADTALAALGEGNESMPPTPPRKRAAAKTSKSVEGTSKAVKVSGKSQKSPKLNRDTRPKKG